MGKLLPKPYPGQSMEEYREQLVNFQKNYWSFLKPSKGGSKFIPLPPLKLMNKTKEMTRKLSEHVEEELFNKEKRIKVDPKKVIKTTPKIVKESVLGAVEPKMDKEYTIIRGGEPIILGAVEPKMDKEYTFGSVSPPVKKKKPYYRKKYDKPKPIEITPEPVNNYLFIKGLITGLGIAGLITIIVNLLT